MKLTSYEIADTYESFEDFPWPLMYRELSQRYPSSKFILTVRRSPESWFTSILRQAEGTGPTKAKEIAYGFSWPHEHKEHYLDLYKRHNKEVQEFFAGQEKKPTGILCRSR